MSLIHIHQTLITKLSKLFLKDLSKTTETNTYTFSHNLQH
jgi:hypothetical protein